MIKLEEAFNKYYNKIEEDVIDEDNLVEDKQVGDVSYCVPSLEILYSILKFNYIKASEPEDDIYNTTSNNGIKQYQSSPYVSLSRNITSHALINEKDWGWGVILDGDKLSNKYKIKPVQQRYPELNKQTNPNIKGTPTKVMRIKILTRYISTKAPDDRRYDMYKAYIAYYGTIILNKDSFDEILAFCMHENDLPSKKSGTKGEYWKFKYTNKIDQKNSKTINGYKIAEEYLWNVPSGGPILTFDKLSKQTWTYLLKHTSLNDTESRVYVNPQHSNTHIQAGNLNNLNTQNNLGIDISNCIKGLVLPNYAKTIYKNNDFSTNEEQQALQSEINYRANNRLLKIANLKYWLEKIHKLLGDDIIIADYKSSLRATDVSSITSFPAFKPKAKKDDLIKDMHVICKEPLDMSNARLVRPVRADEDSVIVTYSPDQSKFTAVTTRISSRILLLGKDENNNIYICIQHTPRKDYELPGGGFSSVSDTPKQALDNELKEELGISINNISNLQELPSYWYYESSAQGFFKGTKSEDKWEGYYNYFFGGWYKDLINSEYTIIDKTQSNGGEFNEWILLDTVQHTDAFCNNHQVSWLKNLPRVLKSMPNNLK